MTAQSPEPPVPTSTAGRWLVMLGSLKLTLVILLLLLASGALALVTREYMTWPLALPFALFALNLGCALVTHPTFRRQTALLVFHLALIAVMLLVATSRLTYLRGEIEVTEGVAFDGHPVRFEAGPWHWWRLDRAQFENHGFSSKYIDDKRRVSTHNRVRWTDAQGMQREAVIGDLEPLQLQGYRFYTDRTHMGFAMVFSWQPHSGPPQQGSVHLPAYPMFRERQHQQWTPPGSSQQLSLQLQFDEVILDPARPSEFRPPREHHLLVHVDGKQHTLVPGGRLELAGGALVYEGLRRWLGYNVFYDWTLPWMLAAGVLAVVSLGWHFWRKFAAQPWNAEAE